MRSVNTVTLIGNVGSAPEIRTTAAGTRLARVSLATGEQWTNSDGKAQERTDWHRLTFWAGLADVVERYVGKGDRIYVQGSLRYHVVDNDDGSRSYFTEINVRDLVMLGSPSREIEREKAKVGGPHPPGLSEPEDDLQF